jgi:hypothetical protein
MTPPDAGPERPIEILEARVEHLEAELEGLQDAIHRQSVLRDDRFDELDRACSSRSPTPTRDSRRRSWRSRRCEVIGLNVGDADTDTFVTAFGLG